MAARPGRAELATVLRRAAHPPSREARFWAIQASLVVIAAVHLVVDLDSSLETSDFPVGVPVALLVVPVTYAALRYGLAGSAATGLWATLLWLPDLLLPDDQGHVGSDLVNLALVEFVAFAIGMSIEAKSLAHLRLARASAERLAVEARYRQLFEANSLPTVVLDEPGALVDAIPAARALFGEECVGGPLPGALQDAPGWPPGQPGPVLRLHDGRDYRVQVVVVPDGPDGASRQVVFEDVTEERSESRRATRYAAVVVQAEEDQRRRLARELHDEPLQLFLHLGRRLQSLAGASGAPLELRDGLLDARRQALDAASRLRSITRDLRPPALDHLGLVPALSSLVARVRDEAGLDAEFDVEGPKARLTPEVELGVFRIVEEAVRNTLRHAKASRLQVALGFGPGVLRVSVADDGRGFEPGGLERLAGEGHLGVLGMTERARLLEGCLEVRSAPGDGTVVEAEVPLRGTTRGATHDGGR